LIVSARAKNSSLIPLNQIQITGTGANRVLRFTPSNVLTGTTQLVVNVSDVDGNVTEKLVTVRVVGPPLSFIQRLLFNRGLLR
jgi:hypothetical protein